MFEQLNNSNKNDNFSYNIDIVSRNNYSQSLNFNFYRNKEKIGIIQYIIEYNQITIGWLSIIPTNSDQSISYHRKGYGTQMLKLFEKYVLRNHKIVSKLVLIPKDFDGITKNNLCTFYEKSGFLQETNGFPFYIKKLRS